MPSTGGATVVCTRCGVRVETCEAYPYTGQTCTPAYFCWECWQTYDPTTGDDEGDFITRFVGGSGYRVQS